jgi:NAD(P)-dependent dehydrogenase (short-subunit alcohol dehydrogenase family)
VFFCRSGRFLHFQNKTPKEVTNSKTALITGSAKRIGAQIALNLAKKGFNLAVHYNNSEKEAQDLQIKIEDLGVKCTLLKADLFDERQVQNLVSELNKIKNCTLLINNASIFSKSNFLESEIDDLEKNFTIHLKVPLVLSRAFSQNCAKNNISGSIINMVDKNISRFETKYFNYTLSKKSLADATKMLALQLAPQIRVNAIAPGFVLNSVDEKNPSEETNKLLAKIPLKTKASAENIVQGVNYLLENKFVTGEILFIDGGARLNHAG